MRFQNFCLYIIQRITSDMNIQVCFARNYTTVCNMYGPYCYPLEHESPPPLKVCGVQANSAINEDVWNSWQTQERRDKLTLCGEML